jgi:hypothetical protein
MPLKMGVFMGFVENIRPRMEQRPRARTPKPILHRLGQDLGDSPPSLLERLFAGVQKIHQERQIPQEQLVTAMHSTMDL